MRRVDVDGIPICLARATDGKVYAIGDLCTHEEAYLSDGDLAGHEIECPLHGSRFNVETGEVSGLPAEIPATTYAVTIEGDDVILET